MARRRWFDGHLDLAYLAARGRDMTKGLGECGGDQLPAAVTFPAMAAGGVRGALGTIFVQKRVREEEAKRRGVEVCDGPWSYDTREEAHEAGVRQLEWYRETRNTKRETRNGGQDLPHIVLMIEGAACLRGVEDFREFYEAGVRVVSLTWAEGSQWAGGDQSGGGITPAGWQLVAELDRRGVIHDVSHLSEQAFWELMEGGKNLKVATHSNPRALLPGKQHPERHLSDAQIRALVAQGGVIGVVLFQKFLVSPPTGQRATIADVLRHIAYFEDVAGRRDFLALGSDMDGGFDATLLPEGLDSAEKVDALGDALAGAGWSDEEIERFAWGNWARVLGIENEI